MYFLTLKQPVRSIGVAGRNSSQVTLFAGTNFSELGMQLIWRVLILAFYKQLATSGNRAAQSAGKG